MTLLSPPYALGAAGQVLSGKLLRLSQGAAFRNAAAGVQGVSGILYGPAGTMGELTLNSNTSLTINPFRAVVQQTQDVTQGQYLVVNDAAVTGTTAVVAGLPTMPAQDASQWRRAYVAAYVADSQVTGVASSALTDRAVLDILPGALAATSGAAAYPAVPANALLLGELLIPPVGQAVTLTAYNPRTTTRGGILPVIADGANRPGHDGDLPLHDGQYRDHPTAGLQRGKGGAWGPAVDLDRPVMRLSIGSPGYPVPTNFTDNMGWTVRDDPSGMVEGAGPTWTFVTVPRGGYYQVNLGANFATVGTYRIGIMMQTVGQAINGASGLIGKIGLHGGAGGDTGVSVSDLVYLTAGQRLRCGLYHDLAGNSSIGPVEAYATSFWSMAWLRP